MGIPKSTWSALVAQAERYLGAARLAGVAGEGGVELQTNASPPFDVVLCDLTGLVWRTAACHMHKTGVTTWRGALAAGVRAVRTRFSLYNTRAVVLMLDNSDFTPAAKERTQNKRVAARSGGAGAEAAGRLRALAAVHRDRGDAFALPPDMPLSCVYADLLSDPALRSMFMRDLVRALRSSAGSVLPRGCTLALDMPWKYVSAAAAAGCAGGSADASADARAGRPCHVEVLHNADGSIAHSYPEHLCNAIGESDLKAGWWMYALSTERAHLPALDGRAPRTLCLDTRDCDQMLIYIASARAFLARGRTTAEPYRHAFRVAQSVVPDASHSLRFLWLHALYDGLFAHWCAHKVEAAPPGIPHIRIPSPARMRPFMESQERHAAFQAWTVLVGILGKTDFFMRKAFAGVPMAQLLPAAARATHGGVAWPGVPPRLIRATAPAPPPTGTPGASDAADAPSATAADEWYVHLPIFIVPSAGRSFGSSLSALLHGAERASIPKRAREDALMHREDEQRLLMWHVSYWMNGSFDPLRFIDKWADTWIEFIGDRVRAAVAELWSRASSANSDGRVATDAVAMGSTVCCPRRAPEAETVETAEPPEATNALPVPEILDVLAGADDAEPPARAVDTPELPVASPCAPDPSPSTTSTPEAVALPVPAVAPSRASRISVPVAACVAKLALPVEPTAVRAEKAKRRAKRRRVEVAPPAVRVFSRRTAMRVAHEQ